MNASPLNMGLLRANGPYLWHPASKELKETIYKAASICHNTDNIDFADVAMQYALSIWKGTIIGLSSIDEINTAINNFHLSRDEQFQSSQQSIYKKIHEIIGPHLNETLISPP